MSGLDVWTTNSNHKPQQHKLSKEFHTEVGAFYFPFITQPEVRLDQNSKGRSVGLVA